MKKVFLPIIFLSIFGNVNGQQPLDLGTVIQAVRQNNIQISLQEQDISLSKEELKGSLSAFLPQVSAEYTGMWTNDPMNAFGFKLQHRNISQADFDPQSLNHPGGAGNFNTHFSLLQPILNFDALAARKVLKNKLNAHQYQRDFVMAQMELEAKKAFTNLQFLYEAEKAIDKGIATYQEIIRNTENMESVGYAQAADVLSVKVGLGAAQNQKLDIENNIANLSDYLSWLMGKEGKIIYQPTEQLTLNAISPNDGIFSSERSDILAMRAGIEAQKEMTHVKKNGLLPRLNAFADFNMNDSRPFNFGGNNYLTGFSISWDIFKGAQLRSEIKQNKLQVDKSQTALQLYIEQQQLALDKEKRNLIKNQAKIDNNKVAQQQAEEALRILLNRFSEGLEKTSDVLMAQTTVLEKQVNYLNAVKDYNLTQLEIQFLIK